MSTRPLSVGDPVEVRTRFTGGWAGGFCVAETTDVGYRLARISDGTVLSAIFEPKDVVPAPRRPRGTWELR